MSGLMNFFVIVDDEVVVVCDSLKKAKTKAVRRLKGARDVYILHVLKVEEVIAASQ